MNSITKYIIALIYFSEKVKELVQHIDQYIELIEIVEEITAVIKIESLQETANIARELRESIAATEPIVEIKTGNIVHEISPEQLHLSHKLQKAMSTLLVQVYDYAQELAPGIEEEVLQRIAKVTAHLQADLVAVTGVKIAVQAPVKFVVEEEKPFDVSHKPDQIQNVPSVSTDRVAESSETVVLENVENISVSNEHASAEQLVDEKIAAECLTYHVQETTELLTQELDSLQATEEIDVKNSTLPVLEQMKFIEDKTICTEEAIKRSDTLTAASTEEGVVESESDKVQPTEAESVAFDQLLVKDKIEESINIYGKFLFHYYVPRFMVCGENL